VTTEGRGAQAGPRAREKGGGALTLEGEYLRKLDAGKGEDTGGRLIQRGGKRGDDRFRRRWKNGGRGSPINGLRPGGGEKGASS